VKTAIVVSICATAVLLGCGKKTESTGAAATNATHATTPLSAPADYLGAIVNARDKAIKTVDTVNIEGAIRMYQTEHGKNPKSLEELVQEKYLTSIPAAPYGMKIVYDAATGTVKVVKQ
jgi:hypothetical protein